MTSWANNMARESEVRKLAKVMIVRALVIEGTRSISGLTPTPNKDFKEIVLSSFCEDYNHYSFIMKEELEKL